MASVKPRPISPGPGALTTDTMALGGLLAANICQHAHTTQTSGDKAGVIMSAGFAAVFTVMGLAQVLILTRRD